MTLADEMRALSDAATKPYTFWHVKLHITTRATEGARATSFEVKRWTPALTNALVAEGLKVHVDATSALVTVEW